MIVRQNGIEAGTGSIGVQKEPSKKLAVHTQETDALHLEYSVREILKGKEGKRMSRHGHGPGGTDMGQGVRIWLMKKKRIEGKRT